MRCGHAEALQVEVGPDPHGVARLAVVVVVVHAGLDQEGVLALGAANLLHPLLHRLDDDRGRGRAHVVPHGLVRGYLGRLGTGEKEGWGLG